MLFLEIAKAFEGIEKESSRLKITEMLSSLYLKMTPDEAKVFSYLIQGKIAPDYYGLNLGVGEKLVIQAIALASGYNIKEVEQKNKELGDLGKVAEYFIKKRKQKALFSKHLSIKEVFEIIYRIAIIKGEGSVDLKIRYISELLNNSSPLEARYIIRIILNKLRLGIGDPTILDALSWSKTGGKSLREDIERAYNLCSDLGLVAYEFIKDVNSITHFSIKPFRPLRPALAERLPSAKAIFDKLNTCAVEFKYDGFRMQVHKKGQEVRIFSRRLERMEHMFPDLIETIKQLPYNEIIFEGEALAYNEKQDRFYSFQETMHRRRKYGIEKASEEWPLYLYVFDLLYLDGVGYIDMPFIKRRQALEKIFPFSKNLRRTHFKIAHSAKDIEEMFNIAMKKKLEGIMAKDLNAPYKAGKREFAWIKLKKSYINYDTIDAVIVGYYYGTGARTKFQFGGLLAAVYNPNSDRFETIAKVASGFSEEELVKFRDMLKPISLNKKPRNVFSHLKPDVWVEPKYVIEVLYDEITKSKMHTCNYSNGEGYALRFPRFYRLREDKSIYDATTSHEIEELFYMQKG